MRKLLGLILLLPTLAFAQPIAGNTTAVTGTVTCNAGTNLNTSSLATSAKQDTGNASLSSIDGKITACNTGAVTVSAVPANQSVNLNQIAGNAVSAGNGASGTGVQRVTIANDSTGIVNQGGTWTVQPGNTANTTAWLTSQTPATSGGLTTYHLVSGASTNATNIKASAGQLYCYSVFNTNAAMRKLAFHNTAGSPTAGASVFFSLPIPGGGGANVCTDSGIAFSSGIAITTVTEGADSGTSAVGSGDLIINLFYK